MITSVEPLYILQSLKLLIYVNALSNKKIRLACTLIDTNRLSHFNCAETRIVISNDVIIVGQLKRIILLQLEPLLRKLTKGPVLHTIATLSRRVSNQKLTNRHDILESWHDCIQSINIVAMLYRFSSFSCYLVCTRFHEYYENFIHSMHDRSYLYIRIRVS